jgi:hypothetical protein
MRKIEPLLAQGWQLQGPVAQETGWRDSTRYAATLVNARPAIQGQPPATAPPAQDPTLAWAIVEIQKLQQHCQSLEARVRSLEQTRSAG